MLPIYTRLWALHARVPHASSDLFPVFMIVQCKLCRLNTFVRVISRGEVEFAANCKRNSPLDTPYMQVVSHSDFFSSMNNMPQRRKHTRRADAIVISSSSDTSEASEDSTPESDPDNPSKHGGFAAENDMSERQTRKVNSGSFGMFNRPTLMPKTPPRTLDSGRKKRVKEYSAYQEIPRSRRRRGRKTSVSEVIELDYENEENQSLFIPDHTAESAPITVADDSEDEQDIYSGMTPERAQNAKEYLHALSLVESAEKRLRNVEQKLGAAITEHTNLSWKLATIDVTADNKISDIIRQRDEAIKIANEHAEEKIKCVRERLPAKREGYEERLRDIAGRRKRMEERIAEVKSELQGAEERKGELERQGGFELCSDVREVQARGGGTLR